jgi:hypothetical protein
MACHGSARSLAVAERVERDELSMEVEAFGKTPKHRRYSSLWFRVTRQFGPGSKQTP